MTVFVDGEAVRDAASSARQKLDPRGLGDFQWLSGGAEAVDQGIRFGATYKAPGLDAVENYEPPCSTACRPTPSQSPRSRARARSSRPSRGQPALGDVTGRAERMLGVGLDELAGLLRGEGAFYLRPAVPIPEAHAAAVRRERSRREADARPHRRAPDERDACRA